MYNRTMPPPGTTRSEQALVPPPPPRPQPEDFDVGLAPCPFCSAAVPYLSWAPRTEADLRAQKSPDFGTHSAHLVHRIGPGRPCPRCLVLAACAACVPWPPRPTVPAVLTGEQAELARLRGLIEPPPPRRGPEATVTRAAAAIVGRTLPGPDFENAHLERGLAAIRDVYLARHLDGDPGEIPMPARASRAAALGDPRCDPGDLARAALEAGPGLFKSVFRLPGVGPLLAATALPGGPTIVYIAADDLDLA